MLRKSFIWLNIFKKDKMFPPDPADSGVGVKVGTVVVFNA